MDTSRLTVSVAELPNVVDLSANLPPVGSQGRQSSCVGWALGYYYKAYQESVERGWDLNLAAHRFSPSWIYNQRPTSDCSRDAGMTFWAGFSILQNKGAATEAVFPYTSGDPCTQPSQDVIEQAEEYRIDSFANVFSGRVGRLKRR